MKQTFALKAIVLGAALAFSQASQAINIQNKSTVQYFNTSSKIFNSPISYIETWNVVDGSSSVLAFCIDPFTGGKQTVTNYSAISYVPTDLVRNLYESSYSKVFVNGVYDNNKGAAFQLALWSLTNPTGSIVLAESGGQYAGNDDIAHDANTWVQAANTYQFSGTPQYAYTEYMSATHASQTVLSVSAVPEPESWAMMMLGVGLVGFMGRRHAKKSEQFAA